MLINPSTASGAKRVQRDVVRTVCSFACAGILAVATAFATACSEAPKPAPAAAPPAAETAPAAPAEPPAIAIQCPTRGGFVSGPTYFSQFYEDYILAYVFKGQNTGFYVDVGANDPDVSSVTKYFYQAGWRGINIEPIPELAEKLKKVRPEDANEGVAIGDKPGQLTFYKGEASGLSTLSAQIAASHIAKGYKFTTMKVPVVTLNSVLEKDAKDKTEITFLNIDVEGFEKQVLSSLDFTRYRPRVVMAESTAPMTEVATHQAWEAILIRNGYLFAMDDGLNRYYVYKNQENLLPRFIEANFCVMRDKLEKHVKLDGFTTR